MLAVYSSDVKSVLKGCPMKFLTLLALTFVTAQGFAKTPITVVPKVIYGTDDRMDVFESSDNLMKELSLSTAAQILNPDIIEKKDGTITIKGDTLQQSGMCKEERFSSQPTAANCSGFLIAEDKLVTAGHCVTSVDDCKNHKWVFDFANKDSEKKNFVFTKDQVFTCTSIIERKKDVGAGADYAVVKLDRKVTGRTPLKYRTEGKLADDAVLTVIGHPTGLPLKITSAADMRNNTNDTFFVMNSDTYGGNSGSAVVDARTGIVEGILVRGDTDFQRAPGQNCMISVVRAPDAGRGEDATRITIIKALNKK